MEKRDAFFGWVNVYDARFVSYTHSLYLQLLKILITEFAKSWRQTSGSCPPFSVLCPPPAPNVSVSCSQARLRSNKVPPVVRPCIPRSNSVCVQPRASRKNRPSHRSRTQKTRTAAAKLPPRTSRFFGGRFWMSAAFLTQWRRTMRGGEGNGGAMGGLLPGLRPGIIVGPTPYWGRGCTKPLTLGHLVPAIDM